MARYRSLLLPAVLVSLLLGGCKMQTGSHHIDHSRSFTLQRTTQYFWSRNVERWLTVSRMPDCQRKHRLDDDASKQFSEIRIRHIDDNTYQIQDGKTLLLANLEQCTLTPIDKAAEQQGTLLGKFAESQEKSIPFETSQNDKP